MARNLTTGSIIRVAGYGFLNGQLSINRWHYVCQGPGVGVVSDLDFVNSFDTAVATAYKGVMSSAAQFLGWTAQVVFPLPIQVRQESIASAGPGTRGGTPMPTVVCGITEWLSVMAGRSGRGRTYWPFPANTDVSASAQPVGLYISALGTASTAILNFTTVTGGGGSIPVQLTLHSKTAFLPNLTGFTVKNKFASQHRRGAYGKTNVSPL